MKKTGSVFSGYSRCVCMCVGGVCVWGGVKDPPTFKGEGGIFI